MSAPRSFVRCDPNGSIVDGELVALDPSGKQSFSLIQNSATSGARFVFFAFDLLQFEGMDLTGKPLADWRNLLRTALRQNESVQLSGSFQIRAEQMLALVRGHGLEGCGSQTAIQHLRAWTSCSARPSASSNGLRIRRR